MDYRDTPAARPAASQLDCGDVITPIQAQAVNRSELNRRALRLEYDGDGVGGTAVAVLLAFDA